MRGEGSVRYQIDETARRRRLGQVIGLTLLEVVLALAVLGVLGAVFTTAFVSNLRHTTTAGQRTQAAQVLNYVGRRVVGGDRSVVPALGSTLSWDYGELGAAFPDIAGGEGVAEPERYSVTVTGTQNVTLQEATVVQYDLSVCFNTSDGESCVRGTTLGSARDNPSGTTPPLPGIN